MHTLLAGERLFDQWRDFRNLVAERDADEIHLRAVEQLLGRAIDDRNAALGIETDDARSHAREHRLGKTAALIDLVARADDVFVLRAKLVGHLVEALAEVGEIPLTPPQGDFDVEISRCDEIGGADQAADWGSQPIREIQSE